MILSKLILTGFKSFCDRTEFEFHDGVTCIVGPNGCGKSNVVDAIKWVLGEQSAKSLRGQQMMDMIFNGSSTRRGSGFAQVDLVFDNADRVLDLDQSEITIGRRLYRSGESDYLLNQQPCRLKDIRELLLDTGIGVDAYSVIEQGRVDAVLQSNPSERRLIFDEAAGISKYKARRKEAERKLLRTEQNLLRAQDIIDELERRLRSVKLAAGKARRFQEHDRRLRELRSTYAMAEYHRLSTTKEEAESQSAVVLDHRTQLEAQLSRRDAENGALDARLLDLDGAIDQSNDHTSTLKSQMTALQERVRLIGTRQAEQHEILQSSRQRAEAQQQRINQIEANLRREEEELPTLEGIYTEQARRVAELTDQEQALARTITEAQASLDDEKSGIIDLLRESADVNNEITGLDKHSELLRDQKDRLQARHGEIGRQMEEALGRRAVAQQRLAEIEDLLSREAQRLTEKQSLAQTIRREREQLAESLATLKADRSGLLSQQEILRDLEHKMEGVDKVVRGLLQRKVAEPHNPQLQAIHGTVADVVSTSTENLPVVEAALEDWSQFLVVDHSAAFLALNGEVGELSGRLRVLCLDRLPPFVRGRDYGGAEGFVANAIDLVSYPQELEYLVRQLLGRTVVVDTLQRALELAREDIHGHRFITTNGEVVDGRGVLALGPKSELTGAISRKSHLQEIACRLIELDARIQSLTDALNRRTAESEHLEKLLQNLQHAISENHASRAETQAQLQHAIEAVNRLTQEQPLIAGEVQLIAEQISAAMTQATKNKESLSLLQKQNTQREQEIAAFQNQVSGQSASRQELLEALTETRIATGKLVEKKTALQDTIYSLTTALEAARQSFDEHTDQIAQCQSRIAESEQAQVEADHTLQALEGQLQAHEQGTLELRRQREELREAKERLSAESKGLRSTLSEVEEQLHQLQMKIQEVAVRREGLRSRIQDELGIDLAAGYESYQPQEGDWEAVEAEIEELSQKIARLGNINLDAISEQAELEERVGFLNAQRIDLQDSRRQLEELIEKLNAESRERFAESFQQIRSYFQEMFRKLFGGGKADVVLDSTCEDILEAGIEILARPPGKELQNINLMSGGEKSLTAIALLMSILKTRPSPFVLLDEVDAALDEANNERFNSIIGEFLENSQFIVITHSKRTMHIADSLYGVTMQEPGVSRRVAVRFDEQPSTAVA